MTHTHCCQRRNEDIFSQREAPSGFVGRGSGFRLTAYGTIHYRRESMAQSPSLLCIGLTTVDVVALPVEIEPFEGVRLINAMKMAPAGTAAGTALVAAKLQVATRLAGAVGADAAGRFIRGELIHAGVDVALLEMLPGLPT